MLLAAIIGAGLAIAGTATQAAVSNPLAESYILRVSSGASVGFLVSGSFATAGLGQSAASFVGAMIALLLGLVLGQQGYRISPVRLVT